MGKPSKATLRGRGGTCHGCIDPWYPGGGLEQRHLIGTVQGAVPEWARRRVRPIGASQVTASITLCERLDTQPAAVKVKAQVMDDFDKYSVTDIGFMIFTAPLGVETFVRQP